MDIGRAFYENPPDAKKLAAWGLRPSDYPDKLLTVWPEHVAAYALFSRCTTQWRVGGMGGATGLDYMPVLALLDRMHSEHTAQERDETFRHLQAIERGALEAMNAQD